MDEKDIERFKPQMPRALLDARNRVDEIHKQLTEGQAAEGTPPGRRPCRAGRGSRISRPRTHREPAGHGGRS